MTKKASAYPIREGMGIDVPAIGPDYRYRGTGYTTKGTVLFVSQTGGFALVEIKTKAGSIILRFQSTAAQGSQRTAHGINPSRDISPAPVLGYMGMYCRRGGSN